MSARAKVVIVQPYVPTYRVPFFEKLRSNLAVEGIDCLIAAGTPTGDQAKRGDQAREDWIIPLQLKTLGLKGKSISMPYIPTPWDGADAVILGLEGTSLSAYQALLSKCRTDLRVGMWGHIRPYVSKGNTLDLWLEKQQMKMADHIFAYTLGGRHYAIEAGVPSNKVTAVMNSVDTTALEAARAGMEGCEKQQFIKKHGLEVGSTICFIGGVDQSKRIEFLVDVLDEIWARDSSIRMLMGGDGPQKHLLNRAITRGQVIDFGHVDNHTKALILDTSKILVMPGRIGLVAVDALAMGVPMVTVDWPYHAPEAEYLVEGTSRLTAPNNPAMFASTLLELLQKLETRKTFPYPTLDDMVKNFAIGVRTLLSA